ncbi:MAG: protein-L-isoaspartate O-methyltransferase [Pseudomonadota bacterium]
MDYKAAREAMVDSQIHPMGVSSERILNAFLNVPREEFVPDALKDVCYCDEDIQVAPGRYLMEPSVFARLIQEAKISPEDAVLTIGSGIGYNAAILAHLCGTVVALEDQEELVKTAQESWNTLDIANIAAISGELIKGAPKYAPYDAIIFNGAISELPAEIAQDLKVGGKILAIIRKKGLGLAQATLFEKNGEESLSSRLLFEAGTPYLSGFAPSKEFVF